ncbi:MAG: hypothetical protein HFF56_02165 [Lawsonibacter sp.]|nr:hypothetical protein [Lawsonibacter sp.]MCI8810589.1 hypothetical protein [Oscillibacter sp.]
MPEKQFIMRWRGLGKQVRVRAIDHNQEIFSWFVKNLPTSCLQTETVVAGKSLFMLNVPMKKVACDWIQEERRVEDVVQMPIGRMTFFMTTGNVADISCKFGQMTEPMSYVTWAEVIEEDKPILVEVGELLWENTMCEKKPIIVEFVDEEG